MNDPLPLDRYPQIVFGNETGTSNVSQTDEKSGTRSVSHFKQKSGTSRKSHKCLMCPEMIKSRAKTCSENCRRASNRRKEQICNTSAVITSNLRQLQRYAAEWPDLIPEIMNAVNQSCVAAAVASRHVSLKI